MRESKQETAFVRERIADIKASLATTVKPPIPTNQENSHVA